MEFKKGSDGNEAVPLKMKKEIIGMFMNKDNLEWTKQGVMWNISEWLNKHMQ